ncbi:MAG: GAF domain-containing protein [Roseiflexaceae bacterium]
MVNGGVGMSDSAHILIVDDNQSIRRVFQQLLVSSGYRVSTASSAEEALAYMDLVTPDLILMDLNLPGMNGIEATAKIKAAPNKPFIPIMLVTARGEQNMKVQGLDAGADDFLVKPVDLTELLARVRALLRLQRSRRSLRAEQRKTELLLHLTRALGTTLDFDQLLTHFLNRLADAVGATRASIILLIEEQPRLYSSTRNRPVTPLTEILREGIAGWVLRNKQPAIIADTRNDNRWMARTAIQQIVRSVAAMPIIRDERSLGVITLVHHTPGYFNDEHIDLLTSVAAQCAFAVENAELFQLTRSQKELLERRAEELQQINEVSRYIGELMSPDQLLRLVTQLIHRTFGYPRVTMHLREGGDLVVRAVAGDRSAETRLLNHQPLDTGFVGYAASNQEIVSVGDIPPNSYQELSSDESARSVLAVPVTVSRELFGVLEVTSPLMAAFGTDDIRLLGTLAAQLGVALKNAQLFDTEQRRVRQLERVNNLSIAITAQLDLATNLHVAAEALATIFDVPVCGVALGGPGSREVTQVAIFQAPTHQFRFPMAAIACVELSNPEIIADIRQDRRFDHCRSHLDQSSIVSLALAPLISAGRQVGLIAIDATEQLEQFARSERTLLETTANLIAQVIDNARLYREVEDERSTLNAVLGGAADPILLIDPQDRLLLANRAAFERLPLEHGIGQPIADLDLHPDLKLSLSDWAATIGATHEVTLPDGATFSVSIAPVNGGDSNTNIGRVAVIQDISAIKELERREQERLRSVFRRYVSPQVAEEVLAGGVAFGEPVERNIIVLFADIRGYTALTEGLPARVLVEQVLNPYFNAMTEAMHRHDGTVDKFMGDGMIGLFGVPIIRPDDIERSIAAAIDMQRAFHELRQRWRLELKRDIGMGIGMSYGPAVVGNIGSTQRLDYTVIGDVVNTASRLNGLAQEGQIVVSHHLVDSLRPGISLPGVLRERGPVLLKGKQEPHLVYEVEYQRPT